MAKNKDRSWVSTAIQSAVGLGFRKAYPQVRLDPDKYFHHVRRVYNLRIASWHEMQNLDEQTLRPVSERIIWSASRMAALEGMGLGLGGFATLLPDMGMLAAITLRMLQKLSLVHGFEYSTPQEVGGLWLAAATAAGLDFTREFVEKRAIEHLMPRLIDAMAVKVGAEVAEKWASRLIPFLSAGAAATLNYYFVRSWGNRAREHFLERHRSARGKLLAARALLPDVAEAS
jgi:hypothetical protein